MFNVGDLVTIDRKAFLKVYSVTDKEIKEELNKFLNSFYINIKFCIVSVPPFSPFDNILYVKAYDFNGTCRCLSFRKEVFVKVKINPQFVNLKIYTHIYNSQ